MRRAMSLRVDKGINMRIFSALIIAAITLAGTAQAEPVNSKSAKSMLFKGKGRSVEVFEADFMGKAEIKALEQYARQFDYYGAFAVSAGDPVENASAVGLANFHSEGAARSAALMACNAKRTTGKECMILAVVHPKGFKPRVLTLSAEASDAVRKDFRKMEAPKGFAISPSTGAWAMARGDGGRALSSCNDRSQGARDCELAIFDPVK